MRPTGDLRNAVPPWWPGVCQEYSKSSVNFMSAAASGGIMTSEVAADRGRDAATDEGGGVLESPDELIDHAHDFDRDRRRLAALGHAGRSGSCHCANGRTRSARGRARGSCRLPDDQSMSSAWIAESEVITERPSSAECASITSIDAALHFRDQCARGAAFRRRGAQLIVDDEGAQGQTLDAACDHREISILENSVQGAGVTQLKNLRLASSRGPKYLPYRSGKSDPE